MDPEARIADHYDDLAEHWAEIVDAPERTEALWPTLDRMLPDLDGARVLDAGCGAGVYAEVLDERGADVVGVDVSDEMLREARARVPDATFVEADLSQSLDVLEPASVDVVLCQHVFSHLPDLTTPLAEFARVLVDGGHLVVSTHNPVRDYVVVRDGEYPTSDAQADLEADLQTPPGAPNYTETERFDVAWNPDAVANRATYYRRSVEDLLTPLLDAAFTLEAVVEPAREGAETAVSSGGDAGTDYPSESICLRASL